MGQVPDVREPTTAARRGPQTAAHDASERPTDSEIRQRLQALAVYRSRIVAAARTRGVDPETAEDVAHDTLMRAATAVRPIAGDPWPYLATITKRLVIDHHRSQARAAAALPRIAHSLVAPAADHRVAERDHAERLLSQLKSTEPFCTVAMIVARVAYNLSWPELAAHFDVKASMAQSRVRRALIRLSDTRDPDGLS